MISDKFNLLKSGKSKIKVGPLDAFVLFSIYIISDDILNSDAKLGIIITSALLECEVLYLYSDGKLILFNYNYFKGKIDWYSYFDDDDFKDQIKDILLANI